MERRERYDPEDIESLLSERSFDALLDEERAFVLRHLSGREEYEQMRALLHYARPDERLRKGTVEPDDRVRQNVMAAFRTHQEPQWKIWLNSLAAWAKPTDMAQLWRPALALGSIALLVVAGVVAVREFSGTEPSGLAELEKIPASKKDAQTTPDPISENTFTPGDSGEQATALTPVSGVSALDADASPGPTAEFELAEKSIITEALQADEMKEDQQLDDIKAEETQLFSHTAQLAQEAEADATLGHLVTADELARNMSTVNATGVEKGISAKRSKALAEEAVVDRESRSVAQDPAILGLLAAGW